MTLSSYNAIDTYNAQNTYKAWIVEQHNDQFFGQVKKQSINDLPDNDLLIRVAYSSLNYKDALSATGDKGVTKTYPHTPGIDAVGKVESDRSQAFSPGDTVIVTGHDLGMNTPGGFGQYIKVPAQWAVALPNGLSAKESMIWGTAGFTAALSVDKLTQTIAPSQGDILVTGATGGVGSIAAGILSHLGYAVVGLSGKKETFFLQSLGIKEVINRENLLSMGEAALLKNRWAGVIDTVGGEILSAAIRSTQMGGIITCCGNVTSGMLSTSIYPFILRGISLMGVNSQNCPMDKRRFIWDKLAREWKFNMLEHVYTEIGFSGLQKKIDAILKGELIGRTILKLD